MDLQSAVIGCKTHILPGVDVRGDGGYVIAPPSQINGKVYAWEEGCEIGKIAFTPPPTWLIDLISNSKKDHDLSDPDVRIVKSKRNTTLASMAGTFRSMGYETERIFDLLQEINRLRCSPPLPEPEVRNISKSIGKYAPGTPKKESFNPNAIAEAILKEHALIFCDDIYYEYSGTVYRPFTQITSDGLLKKNLAHGITVTTTARFFFLYESTLTNPTPTLIIQQNLI